MKTRWEQDIVLYLSGAADYNLPDASSPGDTHLARVLLRKAGVRPDAFHSAEQFIERLGDTARDDDHAGRRVWILLDGLNEAERFQDLIKALDGFLPVVERHPWLRLVVTMRSGAYHSLARRDLDSLTSGSAVFKNAARWHHFETGRPQHRPGASTADPFLEIRPFHLASEGQAGYELRQKAPGMPSCPAGYASLTQYLRNLVLSPLRLHLFHEAFAGIDHPPALLRDDVLFDAFLDRLTDEHPGLAETLPAIGKLMLEKRRALLPLEDAVDFINRWYSRTSMSSVERHAKLNPMEELVSASILLRPAEEGLFGDCAGYQFTHQKLAEAVLRRALLRRISPRTRPTRDELLQWAELAVGMPWPVLTPSASPEETSRVMGLFYEYLTEEAVFPELTGALESFAATLVDEGDGATAADLLEIVCETVRQRLFGSALLAFARLYGQHGEPPVEAVRFLSALEDAAPQTSISIVYFFLAVKPVIERLERSGLSRPALLLARLMARQAWAGVVVKGALADRPGYVPHTYWPTVTSALSSLWSLARSSGHFQEARRFAEDSLALLRKAASLHNLTRSRYFHPSLIASLIRLASLLDTLGDLEGARRISLEALDVRRALLSQSLVDPDLQRDLAEALDQSSRVAGKEDLASGLRLSEASISLCEHFLQREPDSRDARYQLGVALDTGAWISLASSDFTGAAHRLTSAEELLAPFRTGPDLHPLERLGIARHELIRHQFAIATGRASPHMADALEILGKLEASGFRNRALSFLRYQIESPVDEWCL